MIPLTNDIRFENGKGRIVADSALFFDIIKGLEKNSLYI